MIKNNVVVHLNKLFYKQGQLSKEKKNGFN